MIKETLKAFEELDAEEAAEQHEEALGGMIEPALNILTAALDEMASRDGVQVTVEIDDGDDEFVLTAENLAEMIGHVNSWFGDVQGDLTRASAAIVD